MTEINHDVHVYTGKSDFGLYLQVKYLCMEMEEYPEGIVLVMIRN